MGKKVAVNLRLDEDLKKGFDHVCSEMGITATAAITMFAAKTVKEQRIPFELTTYPSNEEALNRYMAYVNKVKKWITIEQVVCRQLDIFNGIGWWIMEFFELKLIEKIGQVFSIACLLYTSDAADEL